VQRMRKTAREVKIVEKLCQVFMVNFLIITKC
jgi:hypothetical protein